MQPEDQLRCERECTRLCYDFAFTVDHMDYDAFVALFAADGVFDRAGLRSAGHEAIRNFLNARPTGRVTRHLISNVRINMTSATSATGTCSALMYAAAGTATPLPVTPPLVVDYTDDYVLTADGWKIKLRQTGIVFQP